MWNYMWREHIPEELCFTANTAGSTVILHKYWNPTSITLETSTDGNNWDSYTFDSTITLSNVWDKVYFRNTSETTTWFTTNTSNIYQFEMSWSISWSWDITSLINKNCTTSIISDYCFAVLFSSCSSLMKPPKLPATVLTPYCYSWMFQYSWLTELPSLPATSLPSYCYQIMFNNCTYIKLSTTQTWNYQTPYIVPITWNWSSWTNSLYNMFANTWWTFTWTPTINTTYYTSNTVV